MIDHKKQTDLHFQGKCRMTTISVLVDDILLQIFDFYRKTHFSWPPWTPLSVWNWLILAHVCRRWRQIIFDSPRRLNLRILCSYGNPVRQNLGIWPAFPIDLQLGSPVDMKPKDEDNAIAALEHRDRVNTVSLSATGSQMGKIAASMQEPFPVLTDLYMRSWDENTPVLPAEFLRGSAPLLQKIALHRIPFPAFPTLLLSASDLDTLNLFDIPAPGYIPPEQMVVCLAALPRLKVFSITYQDVLSRPLRVCPPPSTRPVLPALTFFNFHGGFEYLEDLVARIDSPQLERISTTYLDKPDTFQVMQLSNFIDRSIGPSTLANVIFQFDRLKLILSHAYANYPGCDRRFIATTISFDSEDFEWRQHDVAWVLNQFSVVLCSVVHLELEAQLGDGDQTDDAYDIEWLDILRQFPAMQTLYVSLELAPAAVISLEDVTVETITEVLPSLSLICLEGEPASSPSLERIVAIRQFSDHPITVVEAAHFNERRESYLIR